jgi:arylsulfatase
MPPTENWYMTDAITENALHMMERHGTGDKPFFLYLAYTAPHWPLHAHPEDIEKYRGKYLAGWDELRRQRYQRQKDMKLFDELPLLSPRDSLVPAWESLDSLKKEEMDLKMAVYAAQVECMDRGIGEVMEKIRSLGKWENTLVIFLSDNGACAEGGVFGRDFWGNGAPPGGPDGYHNYGMGWANAGNTPFRKYKQYIHEGGIATPFVVQWPAVIRKGGQIHHQPAHIIDIMATFCDISGAEYPELYNGVKIQPHEGLSMKPLFYGEEREEHTILCWEHIGSAGIRKGNWKLVAARNEPWELYDLQTDRTELNNVIKKHPQVASVLHYDWLAWADSCGVRVTGKHNVL